MKTVRKDPRAEEDDPNEDPIDISAAVRAAKTANTLGRAPVPQETAKMGAFDLEQALAKLNVADKDAARPRMPSLATPAVELTAEELASAGEGIPETTPNEPASTEPVRIEKPIPIPEPSEPGPMVASIKEPRLPREGSRGIPRSTILLILLGIALLAGLYAWSRTLH